METKITFTVNGQERSIVTDPQRSLLDVLREDLHLTGTKYGCGEGQCRACTVLADGKAIPACITSISEIEKQSVLTIEGLSTGERLHPVQEAFLAEGAFQCGYCTAGMILQAVAMLQENAKPTDAQIVSGMNKNLCRCCSYPSIMRAVQRCAGRG